MLKNAKKDQKIFVLDSNASSRIFQSRIVGEWLSSEQAAHFLGLSENALRIMVCRRKVKFSKLGRRLRFRMSDLEGLLLSEGASK